MLAESKSLQSDSKVRINSKQIFIQTLGAQSEQNKITETLKLQVL